MEVRCKLAKDQSDRLLEGQLQSCIKGGLAGTPPELGSPDLVAITAYLGSIAKGQPVEIGGAPK